ncbi:PREDICTED: uncharacterized protein LOC108767726 [Trachymyrmex cornetzi]|uniref:uncharacterized protein LOC108767726 n=1 Tax=Trachymyrmex cornetzi TaxID=471704 RepID=UPI00084EEDA6|nr:PREDICTED: uncharacterized protein LOC108767726 [Trachymyrmex cornetzi]
MASSRSRSRSSSREHKKHRKRSREYKRKRDRSRVRSREVKRSRSFSEDRLGQGSPRYSQTLGDAALLTNILEAVQDQGRKIALLESEVRGRQSRSPAFQPQEEPTAHESRGTEPDIESEPKDSVTFVNTDAEQDGEPSLVSQLFRTQQDSLEVLAWDQVMLDFTRATVRAGLPDDLRTQLLTKFGVREGFASFGPPKLNKLLLPVLKASSTVAKKDEYQALAQTQVAAALNALGTGLSHLTKPEVTSLLPMDGKSALSQIAEGIQLLTDHQYRLSLARRAFIKPALNLLGKSPADLAPIDEWLFGTSFVEEVKDAQACHPSPRSEDPISPETGPSGKRESPCPPVESTVSPGRGSPTEEPVSKTSVPLSHTSPLNPVRTAGRLAYFLHNWKVITSDQEVLRAIQGYKIPFFVSPPARSELEEPTFSASSSTHCNLEIDRLLRKGAIYPVQPLRDQFLSPFFLIDKPSGGRRFILNLKELNTHILPPHFKLEDWRTVVRLMLPNVEMASLDLEDAYLAVPIHPSYRKYLRFRWQGIIYEFAALPFGLATAPYIFTKILRPVVAYLRAEGYESVLYLDDFLLLAHSKEACRRNVQAHINTLSKLGFVINFGKSELEPARRRKYLGFVFDSESQSVAIPETRRIKLYSLVSDFSAKSHCSITDFANMIGSLISVCPAVKYGLFYTKNFERHKFLALKGTNNDFKARMVISRDLDEDFRWWLDALAKQDRANHILTGRFAREIFSDASLTGWGASSSEDRTHGWWSEAEKTLHINTLELKAAFYGLKCFASDLSSCKILLRVDNTTAISYINRFGSVKYPHLSNLSRDIWQWCEAKNI